MSNIELTSILLLAQKASKTEKKHLGKLIARQIDPAQLELFVGSKCPAIAGYVEARRKKLYQIKGSFEEALAVKIGCDLDDLSEWEPVNDREIHYMQKESERARSGDPEFYDCTEALGFIKYNLEIALTSPSAYVRSLAEILSKKKNVQKRPSGKK